MLRLIQSKMRRVRPSMRMPSSIVNRVSDARSPESRDLGLILLSCRHYLPVSSSCRLPFHSKGTSTVTARSGLTNSSKGLLPVYSYRMKVCSERQGTMYITCVKYE